MHDAWDMDSADPEFVRFRTYEARPKCAWGWAYLIWRLIGISQATGQLPTEALPEDKAATLVVHCKVGGRAGKAAAYLQSIGYTDV
eukprot:3344202-Pleurochrysis_carterae.AAC.1